MRAISKGREPASLAEHRCTPGADYDSYRDKEGLRTCLVTEQRGLCCYCLSRIRAKRGGMKIEHWHSRANHPSEQLDYGNLLASCTGNEGDQPRNQHCDTRKGDRDLSRNPGNPLHRIEDFVQFGSDGRIRSNDPSLDAEINGVLNLNLSRLVRNRRAALDALLEQMPKLRPWAPVTLEKHLRIWNGESNAGELEPFCQAVVFWLRKKLARCSRGSL